MSAAEETSRSECRAYLAIIQQLTGLLMKRTEQFPVPLTSASTNISLRLPEQFSECSIVPLMERTEHAQNNAAQIRATHFDGLTKTQRRNRQKRAQYNRLNFLQQRDMRFTQPYRGQNMRFTRGQNYLPGTQTDGQSISPNFRRDSPDSSPGYLSGSLTESMLNSTTQPCNAQRVVNSFVGSNANVANVPVGLFVGNAHVANESVDARVHNCNERVTVDLGNEGVATTEGNEHVDVDTLEDAVDQQAIHFSEDDDDLVRSVAMSDTTPTKQAVAGRRRFLLTTAAIQVDKLRTKKGKKRLTSPAKGGKKLKEKQRRRTTPEKPSAAPTSTVPFDSQKVARFYALRREKLMRKEFEIRDRLLKEEAMFRSRKQGRAAGRLMQLRMRVRIQADETTNVRADQQCKEKTRKFDSEVYTLGGRSDAGGQFSTLQRAVGERGSKPYEQLERRSVQRAVQAASERVSKQGEQLDQQPVEQAVTPTPPPVCRGVEPQGRDSTSTGEVTDDWWTIEDSVKEDNLLYVFVKFGSINLGEFQELAHQYECKHGKRWREAAQSDFKFLQEHFNVFFNDLGGSDEDYSFIDWFFNTTDRWEAQFLAEGKTSQRKKRPKRDKKSMKEVNDQDYVDLNDERFDFLQSREGNRSMVCLAATMDLQQKASTAEHSPQSTSLAETEPRGSTPIGVV
jgi:hypothetical protein